MDMSLVSRIGLLQVWILWTSFHVFLFGKASDVWHERAGKCYLIIAKGDVRRVAKKCCICRGGHLLEIDSAAELKYLNRWLPFDGVEYWTGYEIDSSGGLSTLPGRWEVSQNPIASQVWATDEPNWTGKCARLKPYQDVGIRLLADHPCEKEYHTICQKTLSLNQPISTMTAFENSTADDALCLMKQTTVRSVLECVRLCATSSLCVHISYKGGMRQCRHFQDSGDSICQTVPWSRFNGKDFRVARSCAIQGPATECCK